MDVMDVIDCVVCDGTSSPLGQDAGQMFVMRRASVCHVGLTLGERLEKVARRHATPHSRNYGNINGKPWTPNFSDI